MILLRRPSFLIYAACVAGVFAGLLWLTWQAASLESRELAARQESAQQESMRLALWRMDSDLAKVIAQEAARPYFQYRAFYPADRAFSRMWEPVAPDEPLAPSPLLAGPGPLILLHFEVGPDGRVTSPQAPGDDWRPLVGTPLAEQVAAAESRLADLSRVLGRSSARGLADRLSFKDQSSPEQRSGLPGESEVAAQPETSTADYGFRKQSADAARNIQNEQFSQGQMLSRAEEPIQTAARERQTNARTGERLNDEAFSADKEVADADPPALGAGLIIPESPLEQLGAATGVLGRHAGDAPQPFEQGPLDPVWITGSAGEGPYLLFTRRIVLGGRDYLQGMWMDWPAIHDHLTALIADILPGADIRPIYTESRQTAERLAAIPATLLAPSPVGGVPMVTATRIALALTWAAVVAALAAIGIVLRKSIDLAERRGQFVSAVTHELRTPLTTFCLYTQMLADGMVQTDAARADYLGTLKRESRRLARIVENVLDYARLGQRGRARQESRSVEDMIAALAPALCEQAARAGMDLVIDHAAAAGAFTPADTATVERILTNLVENSTKYAADATDRRLHLDFARRGPWLEVSYRDHGPGIPRSEEGRVFQPFHRAARDSQGPIPGLGLGLALSRGLARELGGDLRLSHEEGHGAQFVLRLPAR